ncbi:tail Collar domain-containing protein [Aliidongia dinghuensis]|uniref:Tail Collar domain-containing protein n=1 Tax=Aliidongia dinghuensis TaxID=1867774 RepID=A0A8J3E645_9PROT|nr:tail fiber protein [Aliidongia dinghuensis]GGF26765.1 tail Collar domain-containing protein [Aliidongia dinghuensis]
MPANPYVGQLMPFASNFAPRGWAICAGQLLPISQNTALFSILGTFYGGNGTSNFALPDLRSRTPIHSGQGPGLSDYVVGEQDGVEQVTLLLQELGPHTHGLLANATAATTASPANAVLAEMHGPGRGGTGFAVNRYTTATSPATQLSQQSVTYAGQAQPLPHNNLQPSLAINWCIALQGIFPARN